VQYFVGTFYVQTVAVALLQVLRGHRARQAALSESLALLAGIILLLMRLLLPCIFTLISIVCWSHALTTTSISSSCLLVCLTLAVVFLVLASFGGDWNEQF